ncbi:tRNA 2-thiouridine(34) synthase MnmA [uncultured Desulfosarcina sp.]|uniref:tRNA 2-thiouridine(34) synthase MnmA n=1 Tax=uncultured Desulfosarcina sp. TaxID=218289 RepID=UPI0029C6FD89|nr:tRNA 2-thiouridine(34) synthase MnmA [uncultured Desulfosarcina sp.]
MTGSIAIAVSGGVDSLVSAYLLKQQENDVFGIHFLTGYEKPVESGSEGIKALSRQLGLPIVSIDLKTQFKTRVVDYFTAAYQNGETPNPCLVCNPTIKFGVLFDEARRLGASRLATGHYARVEAQQDGRYRLCRGVDETKDQSYFLSRLTQDQLARACFPLGTWTKAQVKALAEEKGLHPLTRQESQDVCFIRDASYAEFLTRTAGICPQPGDIVNTAGHRVGTHNGLHRYTVGQRRGINCPASQAYYVVGIDIRRNRLVVGFKDELVANSCRVSDINWIAGVPQTPMAADTRIRYRHRAVPSMVSPVGHDGAVVRFDRPQTAVTPGQGAVFYRGDEVLGGGWIAAE